MNRDVALRAGLFFVIVSVLLGGVGAASSAPLAEALFLIAASMAALTFAFGFAAPAPKAIPVRVSRRGRR